MALTVDNVVEGALVAHKVDKARGEEPREIVVYRNGVGTDAVESVFEELGIPYTVVGNLDEFMRHSGSSCYKIDLSGLPPEDRQPDLERLREYWQKGKALDTYDTKIFSLRQRGR
tara:strand:- start:643 stop:987 length:345 start_codon:yes stop_codon:yes gene_type:complete